MKMQKLDVEGIIIGQQCEKTGELTRIDMVFLCEGKTRTLDACEDFCHRHSSCERVARANDILKEYEEGMSE